MNIKLSISLLASNRLGSLKRCLESLKPLLRKVPSELIVVFTGTDENVRALAESYTEEVVTFAWCDDFSAARNAALERAKGEWFLWIDDDEWFDDVTEICDFFQTGDYKNYASAYYVVRNYDDWNAMSYSDFHAYRMTKIFPQSRFEKPVHEEMLPQVEPAKYFHVFVHHYGYIKDVKNQNRKMSRNLPLLLQEVEKNQTDTQVYLQIVREYYTEEQWREAESWCRKGYALCQKTGEFQKMRWFRIYLSLILSGKSDRTCALEEIQDILENGISDRKKTCELDKLILYQLLVSLYTEEQMPEKVVKAGEEFEHLLEYMDKTPILWEEQMCGDLSESFVKSEENMMAERVHSIAAAFQIQDLKKAEYFLRFLPWEEEQKMQSYYEILDGWAIQYQPYLQEVLKKFTYVSSYLVLQKAKKTGDFSECLECVKDSYLQKQLIKEMLLRQKQEVSVMLKDMDYIQWKKCAEDMMENVMFTDIEKIWKSAELLVPEYPLYSLWLKKSVLEKKLFQGYPNGNELTNILKEYCECMLGFYRGIYKESMFCKEENIGLLPKDCRFALVMLKALEQIEKKQMAEAVSLLRKAMQLLPEMKRIVREIVMQVETEMANPVPNMELEQLAVQMKAALREMEKNHQCREALPVVEQLLTVLPNDLDFLKIRQALLRKLSDS